MPISLNKLTGTIQRVRSGLQGLQNGLNQVNGIIALASGRPASAGGASVGGFGDGPKLNFQPMKINPQNYTTQSSGGGAAVVAAQRSAAASAQAASPLGGSSLLGGNPAMPSGSLISIYLPEEFQVSYNAAYEEISIGAFVGNLAQGNLSNAGSAAASAIRDKAVDMIGSAINVEDAASVYNAAKKGVVRNPQMELLFKTVQFRTFNFTFKFHAQNASETAKIQGMIQQFKQAMHPELSDTGAYFYYPDIFEISYSGKNNSYYNKFAKSVLTDMTVNYAGTGVVSQFDDGAPVETSISLTFKEIEFLTKKQIQQGY